METISYGTDGLYRKGGLADLFSGAGITLGRNVYTDAPVSVKASGKGRFGGALVAPAGEKSCKSAQVLQIRC